MHQIKWFLNKGISHVQKLIIKMKHDSSDEISARRELTVSPLWKLYFKGKTEPVASRYEPVLQRTHKRKHRKLMYTWRFYLKCSNKICTSKSLCPVASFVYVTNYVKFYLHFMSEWFDLYEMLWLHYQRHACTEGHTDQLGFDLFRTHFENITFNEIKIALT